MHHLLKKEQNVSLLQSQIYNEKHTPQTNSKSPIRGIMTKQQIRQS
jgi:hypothetical protein